MPLETRGPGADGAPRRPGGSAASVGSDGADVLGFLALAAGADLELDGLTLGQRRADSLEVRDVHEHVIAAAAHADEENDVRLPRPRPRNTTVSRASGKCCYTGRHRSRRGDRLACPSHSPDDRRGFGDLVALCEVPLAVSRLPLGGLN